MPIDSGPDGPGRVPETPAAPDRQARPDVPDRPEAPGTRAPRAGPGVPDATAFRQEQIAEHLRYQRLADATCQAAARETWARAAPDLRVAWEEHKEKYPERSRATPLAQPDGGWAAEGGRRLTPEQNAEATKACADLRDEADRVILPAMRRVEAASPDGKLAGLEHMLKHEDRLKEKIADYLRAPGVTVRGAIDKVPDAVRFTLKYEPIRYAEGVLADVGLLKAAGFELLKLKNLWHADQYKGVNSQWRRPDTGLRFEMQFHTPESLEAKELTHEAYERIRSKTASSAEERKLEDFQQRANALLATPPGTDRIKDFPE
ncbi:MAG TPA: hypothetical protein VFO01_19640 [Trebonia sp.]|nr:hypothetical protein [Trebonia sp.]